jgi:hypothetical protein
VNHMQNILALQALETEVPGFSCASIGTNA